jgi:hypothetical protein
MDIVYKEEYRQTGELLRRVGSSMPGLGGVTLCWGAAPRTWNSNTLYVSNSGWWQNKLEQYSSLENRYISLPSYTTSQSYALQWLRNSGSSWRDIWGRKANGSRGKGIFLPRSISSPGRKWLESDYWVRKVEGPYDEYRYHIFNGRSIMRSMKVHTGHSWRRADVRNHGNGWTFRRDCPDVPGARDVAKLAVEAMEYTWGAVDMLIKQTETGPTFIVLEVNRFPGMDERTATAYCNAIERYVMESEDESMPEMLSD